MTAQQHRYVVSTSTVDEVGGYVATMTRDGQEIIYQVMGQNASLCVHGFDRLEAIIECITKAHDLGAVGQDDVVYVNTGAEGRPRTFTVIGPVYDGEGEL